jgi:pimeloyl-ACP methyl ester carboxylesterase
VGIGKTPPVFLKPNDEIAVTVTGLGTLKNRIGSYTATNPTPAVASCMNSSNVNKAVNGFGLTLINGKPFNYKSIGSGPPVIFVHGLGGTLEFWDPLIQTLSLKQKHSLHLFDLEGHGLSPTSPLSALSIQSFATDLNGIFEHASIDSGATLISHSMGCLIAARFALEHPEKISKLILLGPPPSPLPEVASKGSYARADTARTKGMGEVVEAVVTAGTSDATKQQNLVALAAVRLSLLGQDPEGYAKGCTALAMSAEETLEWKRIQTQTLIITGDEDKVSPPQLCERMELPNKLPPVILEGVGHWHVFENVQGVAKAVETFL